MKQLFLRMTAVMAIVMLSCANLWAESNGKCGDNLTWTLDDNGVLTISGKGKMYDYKYNRATPWMNKGFQKVVITAGVTSIGNYAFNDSRGLTSVTIGNSVTSIGNNAFYLCRGLTSFTIPYGVTSIGDNAFSYCSGLTSVSIPNSVTSIGESAFYCCSGLTSVMIGNSVTSIGDNVFSACELEKIQVVSGNQLYDSRGECNAIIETQTNSLIVGCKSTKIPSSVTSIGDNAFSYCSGLASVSIPNSVTSIGKRAFSNCSGLTSVSIPNSVTSIGFAAFAYCI